jgi:hypothetical protein
MGDYLESQAAGLSDRGRRLWVGVHEQFPAINAAEEAILLEACRTVDVLDRLDVDCRSDDLDRALVAMTEARQSAKSLMGLLAALRLPHPLTGRRPGRRPPRGAYRPRSPA